MNGGVSIHAVDVSAGVPAMGLRCDLLRIEPEPMRVASGLVAANGWWEPDDAAIGREVPNGLYEAVLHLDTWLAARGTPTFMETVRFRFKIREGDLHHHLPIKFTPWGYALFRGV